MPEPTSILIPALDEETSIGKVLEDIPLEYCHQIIVVDNGSTDRTAELARKLGAEVVAEPRRGYGSACLAGLRHLRVDTEVVVFLDGDFSDYPEELPLLTKPIYQGAYDLVLGSRTLRPENLRHLRLHQRWGNGLSLFLLRLIYGYRFTDFGPFRALRRDVLVNLNLNDTTWGWNVEMQIKSVKAGLRIHEVPVGYRDRIGRSKISGDLRVSFAAGFKILYTVFRHSW